MNIYYYGQTVKFELAIIANFYFQNTKFETNILIMVFKSRKNTTKPNYSNAILYLNIKFTDNCNCPTLGTIFFIKSPCIPY